MQFVPRRRNHVHSSLRVSKNWTPRGAGISGLKRIVSKCSICRRRVGALTRSRTLPDLCLGIVSGRLETQPSRRFSFGYETRSPGTSGAFFSLCVGGHRTRPQDAALVSWSRRAQPLRCGKSRPVACITAGRGAYAIRACPVCTLG